MPPGVLWVSSRISLPSPSSPSPSTTLTPVKFCDWYENQHIHEVTALSGVPGAVRWEAISSQPDDEAWSARAPWLTVYEMPDIEFRQTSEFKGLDGQSKPKGDLLETVFQQARFDTRFYEEIGLSPSSKDPAVAGQAKFLVSWAFQPVEMKEEELERWWRSEGMEMLRGVQGCIRMRRFRVVDATTLDRFVRRHGQVPAFVVLCEFDRASLPVGKMVETIRAGKMKDILEEGTEEIGWYQLKRIYG